MEMLSACQALDLLRPLKPASAVLAAYEKIRESVPFAEKDRVFSRDVRLIRELISDDILPGVVEKNIGHLEF
jgi:histidine ammonia-lyase